MLFFCHFQVFFFQFCFCSQSQASLGPRSVTYAPVPQMPPPIQAAGPPVQGPPGLYYEGGAYPPTNPNAAPYNNNFAPAPGASHYPGGGAKLLL